MTRFAESPFRLDYYVHWHTPLQRYDLGRIGLNRETQTYYVYAKFERSYGWVKVLRFKVPHGLER